MENERKTVGELAVEHRIEEFHMAIKKVGFEQNSLIDGVALIALGVETMRRAGVSNGKIMESIIIATINTAK